MNDPLRLCAMRTSDRFNHLSLPDLYRALSGGGLVRRLLEIARDEDLGVAPEDAAARGLAPSGGSGDITCDCCVSPRSMAVGSIVARAEGVICGMETLPHLVETFGPACVVEANMSDGAHVPAGTTLGIVRGPLDEMLGLERTLLNLLSRLSGVASRSARFVRAIPSGSRAKLYDTRKTTPGMRVLEKYAVRCGGGFCHRIGLFDAVLIKDNHLAGVSVSELPGFVERAARAARVKGNPAFIEVEVDSLEQFQALLTLPPDCIDIVLLDNMSCEQMSRAASMRDRLRPSLELEASGGVTLESIASIAGTGVDRISVGGLTHSAVGLDIALDVEGREG